MIQRLYLSGPITDVPNYLDIFNKAAASLVAEGYRVINPANLCTVMDNKATWDDYMNIDMALERDMIILRWEDLTDGCTEKSRA